MAGCLGAECTGPTEDADLPHPLANDCHWAHRSVFLPPHKKLFRRVLAEHIKDIPVRGLILDVGFGLGDWIEFVTRDLQHKAVGLEIDGRVCRLAKERCTAAPDAGFVLYDGGQFPFKDGSFQLAYAHEVIEHVQEDGLFLAEVHRVLDQRGVVILTTPNGAKEALDPSIHTAHVRHYTSTELRAELLRAGFALDALYWRIHRMCGFLDDRLTTAGRRILRTDTLQPGVSHWGAERQSKWIRPMLWVYRLIDPVLTALILAEFQLLKARVEARNMIVVGRKI